MRIDQLSEAQSSNVLMPASGAPRVPHLPEARTVPVPEVSEKAERRQFTAKYKLRVLQELDRFRAPSCGAKVFTRLTYRSGERSAKLACCHPGAKEARSQTL